MLNLASSAAVLAAASHALATLVNTSFSAVGMLQDLAGKAPAARDFKGAVLAKAQQTGVQDQSCCCKLTQGSVLQVCLGQ